MGDEDAPAAAQGDDEASDAAVQASSSRNRPLTVKEYGKSLSQLLDDDTCAGIILALDARDPLAWDSRWLREQATAKGKPLLCALTRSGTFPLVADTLLTDAHWGSLCTRRSRAFGSGRLLDRTADRATATPGRPCVLLGGQERGLRGHSESDSPMDKGAFHRRLRI